MLINKVVARFKNGDVKKGVTGDFFPNKVVFHLQLETKEILEINIEELKAICFVKDFEGNKERTDDYTDELPGGGRKVQIEFSDDETLVGFTQGYSPTRSGFFVVPADLNNNNARIYVITSATQKVTFL
jgi:hypothetical protein